MNLPEANERLTALALPAADYAVHGSGVLLAHGLIAESHDLDLVARGPAWRAACAMEPPKRHITDLCVQLGDVEVFDGWMGQDLDALIGGAELVGGMRCVKLEHVLAFKERLRRPKDAHHIAIIRTHLGLEPTPDASTSDASTPDRVDTPPPA